MPELPEVETAVRELKRKLVGKKITKVWTDFTRPPKHPASWESFKRKVRGKEIKGLRRRAKNILIDLSDEKVLLIHQKMTGHLLTGKWEFQNGAWVAQRSGPLRKDPRNQFLHLIFFFKDGSQMALSDLRKFSKIELWDRKALENSQWFKKLGPEPLDKGFTLEKFREVLAKKDKLEIKKVLMDQGVISGIGNIYASEILWKARVYPFEKVGNLSEKELKAIFLAIKKILKKGIELKGASYSEFRRTGGDKGHFQEQGKVYDREGEPCPRCGGVVVRKKQGGRSTYFCPRCQKPKNKK
jgi:formamidopyrimidine-DNA glycosylase